ncbi:MAG: permease [Chromatiaceae bacterium]|nr:permease [Chromatiaceae bacterium]
MAENFVGAVWQVLLELSPSLLLGLLIAGVMFVYLPRGFVHRGLSRPDLASVTRASLIGVPLPLCSCGVIPTALGLRREGASKGATTAFLISTPQTGVDSILVSAAFLGWPFALFKVVAAFLTGILGGLAVNRLSPPETPADVAPAAQTDERPREPGLVAVLRYAVFDLLAAIDLWIVLGVLVAAAISVLLPADFFAGQGWSSGLLGLMVVLAISLPLYVCTTGSVPVAASLIAAGLPAGSALVFLMAGPATNVATFGAIYRTLGGRVLSIYLAVVILMSLAFGLLFDWLLATPAAAVAPHQAHEGGWLGLLSALILLGLLALLAARRLRPSRAASASPASDLVLRVEGMRCGHCVASVKQALEGCASVESAEPNLGSGLVRVRGRGIEPGTLIEAVRQAGFQAAESGADR